MKDFFGVKVSYQKGQTQLKQASVGNSLVT